mmetsp:Transcript_20607/g.20978  ORF Transcript_20607/g.20978 Transcript_20607/m.20978 type:complete len:121 (-) Transcript_20607:1232-1594(-)
MERILGTGADILVTDRIPDGGLLGIVSFVSLESDLIVDADDILANIIPTDLCFAGTRRPILFLAVCMLKTLLAKHSDRSDSAADRISTFDEESALTKTLEKRPPRDSPLCEDTFSRSDKC